jgi:hypothetical protein
MFWGNPPRSNHSTNPFIFNQLDAGPTVALWYHPFGAIDLFNPLPHSESAA